LSITLSLDTSSFQHERIFTAGVARLIEVSPSHDAAKLVELFDEQTPQLVNCGTAIYALAERC
jgi:hypothetical protein